MNKVSNNELMATLIKAELIFEEATNNKQLYLSGISTQKMVVVPVSILESLLVIAQCESINRKL